MREFLLYFFEEWEFRKQVFWLSEVSNVSSAANEDACLFGDEREILETLF